MLDFLRDFVADHYLELKVAHLLFLIAWMAGLFYLPRLYVYHHEAPKSSLMDQTFQTMERRLYKVIIVPGMHATLLFGLLLSTLSGTWASGWFHLKLLCVGILVTFQYALNHWRKAFAQGSYPKNPSFFRIINEVPTVLLLIILIAVIIKPF
jgi:putative membrane protein